MAFATKALTLEQWLWCLLFGVGTLLWGQIVTTVPTKKLPKILSYVSNNAKKGGPKLIVISFNC